MIVVKGVQRGNAETGQSPELCGERMNRRKLVRRLADGAVHNVAFADLADLVEGFGFRLQRVSGSHHIFAHPELPELINLQNARGEAKSYQIRQLLRLVERYNLELEE